MLFIFDSLETYCDATDLLAVLAARLAILASRLAVLACGLAIATSGSLHFIFYRKIIICG